MAAENLIPALQTAVTSFNDTVDGKQSVIEGKLPLGAAAKSNAHTARDAAEAAQDAARHNAKAALRDTLSAKANLDHQDLAALAASKAVTAVDLFIYDTSKDSDGGAWRKRCKKTSWFNEKLNTATRGARREFPAVAVIVAEAARITIYDWDNPALPMWKILESGSYFWDGYAGLDCITAGQGKLLYGLNYSVGISARGLYIADFASDTLLVNTQNDGAGKRGLHAPLTSGINGPLILSGSPYPLASWGVNDVAMTVLPDAPVDPATGLAVPTIAVATDGGTSLLQNDGSVVSDNTLSWNFNDTFILISGETLATVSGSNHFYLADIRDGQFVREIEGSLPSGKLSQSVGGRSWLSGPICGAFHSGDLLVGHRFGLVTWTGLTDGRSNPLGRAMVRHTERSFATGWHPYDTRRAFLSDTDATALIGGTDADRSVKNAPLTVTGTITRSPVASGAELVGYSGFSSTDYLEQPYAPELDFGTGDFCVMGWITRSAASDWLVDRLATEFDGSGPKSGFWVWQSGNQIRFDTFENGASTAVLSTTSMVNGPWYMFAALREEGVLKIYVNGKLEAVNSDGFLRNIDPGPSIPPVLAIGARRSNHAVNSAPWLNGSAALLRIAATAPTADQLRRIYEDEKVLFQENAACTLYGISDAVTALAHDPDTGLLHVGTVAGRSVFKGLRRVANTTQPVTTAISAANGLVIEQ